MILRDIEVRRYLTSFSFLPDSQVDEVNDVISGIESDRFLTTPDRAHAATDPILTSLAQLGALRLNAARCLISLIDSGQQYVLAEATRTLSLQDESRHAENDELWLGATIIPRNLGVCGHVVAAQHGGEQGVPPKDVPKEFIINDLQQDERFRDAYHVTGAPQNRFYAGTPMVSPRGTVIGAYCVLDNQPRQGFEDSEIQFLRDMSKTVMNYLSLCMTRDDHRRKEKFLRGIGSFVRGMSSLTAYSTPEETMAADLSTSENEFTTQRRQTVKPIEPSSPEIVQPQEPDPKPDSFPGSRPSAARSISFEIKSENGRQAISRPSPSLPEDNKPAKGKSNSRKLSDKTLHPDGSRVYFSRAAQVLRHSGDMTGVVILDASLAQRYRPADLTNSDNQANAISDSASSRPGSPSSQRSKSSDYTSMPSSDTSESALDKRNRLAQRQKCTILGKSINVGTASDEPGIAKYNFRDYDMRALLRKHPEGVVLTFTTDGTLISSEEGSPSSSETNEKPTASERVKRDSPKNDRRTGHSGLLSLAQGARSIALLPLWDFEQRRWAALVVCWTGHAGRLLSASNDLPPLKVFGTSIMSGLAQLDALVSNKAKTTFMSSISHELRSPLHGILGGTEFLAGTAIDTFQTDMLGTIDQCARTLLDTVNNVLDYTKINDFSQRRRLKPAVKQHDKPGHAKKPRASKNMPRYSELLADIDLDVITEEIVEVVFAGQSLRVLESGWSGLSAESEVLSSSTAIHIGGSPRTLSMRKNVRIILDMPASNLWVLQTQTGVWRRLLMNLIGNALKFTDAGYVYVKCSVTESLKPALCKVHFTVKDTGRGISEQYLRSRLFHAFSQEDSFSSGTGLGLSIVRQLLDAVSGKLDIQSSEGKGTEINISMNMIKVHDQKDGPHRSKQLLQKVRQMLQGTQVCVLEAEFSSNPEDMSSTEKAYAQSIEVLSKTLRDWFDIDVVRTNLWKPGSGRIILCAEPSFDILASLQDVDAGDMPQLVFMCLDAIEAAALREDARVQSSRVPVKIVTQPCGPYKLAAIFSHCLQGQSSDDPGSQLTLPITLPQRPATSMSEADEHVVDISSSSVEEPSPSILIVDDNVINLKLLSGFLRRRQVAHLMAKNGQEAVDLFLAAPANSIRLIFMDLSMPVLDGMSATRAIRQHEGALQIQNPVIVVALTGLASATAKVEALSSGINKFITKPVRFSELDRFLDTQHLSQPEQQEGGVAT